MKIDFSDIVDVLECSSLQFRFLKNSADYWENVSSSVSYLPVSYTLSNLNYQLEYQRGHGGDWLDFSIIIVDVDPVAIWPITLSYKDDKFSISSQGQALLPPLFLTNCPIKLKNRIVKNCVIFIFALANRFSINKVIATETYVTKIPISMWHFFLLQKGALESNRYDLFVDLALPIESIRKHFRKSYKPLINKAKKLWDCRIVDSSSIMPSIWNDFVELHLEVAGRKTRSDGTWEIQYSDVVNNRAFLINLYDSNDCLVGAALFHFTKDESSYSVAAYNRIFFDKPLGHLVQEVAIREMKRRGLRWYKIGRCPLRTEIPEPSAKEISIGMFKQGFATNIKPVHVLEIVC